MQDGEKRYDSERICREDEPQLRDGYQVVERGNGSRRLQGRHNINAQHLADKGRGVTNADSKVRAKARRAEAKRTKEETEALEKLADMHEEIVMARNFGRERAKRVSPLNLPYVLLSDRRDLPRVRGIYFVIDGCDRIVYIGQSVNVRNRIGNNTHKAVKTFGDDLFMRIAYLDVPWQRGWGYLACDYLNALEEALIRRFNPEINATDGGGAYVCRTWKAAKKAKKGSAK